MNNNNVERRNSATQVKEGEAEEPKGPIKKNDIRDIRNRK